MAKQAAHRLGRLAQRRGQRISALAAHVSLSPVAVRAKAGFAVVQWRAQASVKVKAVQAKAGLLVIEGPPAAQAHARAALAARQAVAKVALAAAQPGAAKVDLAIAPVLAKSVLVRPVLVRRVRDRQGRGRLVLGKRASDKPEAKARDRLHPAQGPVSAVDKDLVNLAPAKLVLAKLVPRKAALAAMGREHRADLAVPEGSAAQAGFARWVHGASPLGNGRKTHHRATRVMTPIDIRNSSSQRSQIRPRISKEMIAEETETRQDKTARRRVARLENDPNTPLFVSRI